VAEDNFLLSDTVWVSLLLSYCFNILYGKTTVGSEADISLGMGDFGNLLCESFYQLFGSARLWRGVAGDDPHIGFRQDRRRIDL
jgi:hypothetical protein